MLCKDCGSILYYNSYFKGYVCPHCGTFVKQVLESDLSVTDKDLKIMKSIKHYFEQKHYFDWSKAIEHALFELKNHQ